MARKSKQQKKIEALIETMSKEMLQNPSIQISLFYLLIVALRKATTTLEQPQDPSPEPSPFMQGYWDAVWRKFFGPFASNVPIPEIPTSINEFHLLELALLSAIPLSAGGNVAKGIGDIIDVLT